MSYIIAGLGNPGEEYENTRHNAGRVVLDFLRKKLPVKKEFSDWQADKKLKALIGEGAVGKESVSLLMPDNFMNNSGQSLKPLITSKAKAKNLVVIYDDLDLALGDFKISFNKGDGGHRGLASIIKNIKTREFVRIRVGISPTTPSGKLKKPKGEDKVVDFLMKKFKPDELKVVNKVAKELIEPVLLILEGQLSKSMSLYN